MAVYAIGDVQGCYEELRRALDEVAFQADRDRLWFVGDLVNRGPKSLEVLRFARELGDRAVCVLGNHDLHLLALASNGSPPKDQDTLAAILGADDRDDLLDWMRHWPLAHHDSELGFLMVHAGLPPEWDLSTTLACAQEVETVLRSPDHGDYFRHMYGNRPKRWDPELEGMDRWRYITNCFTRLRYCDIDGNLALKEKGPPGSQKAGRVPWFTHPNRATRDQRIVFGHWSTLGYCQHEDRVWGLDSGCLWGGALTLLQLDGERPEVHAIDCPGQQDPTAFT